MSHAMVCTTRRTWNLGAERAGVVLILEDPKDYKFWIRLNTTIKHFDLPIDTWTTGTGGKETVKQP